MFLDAYRKAIGVIAKKPIMLWGLSLLSVIITGILGGMFAMIPVAGIAFSAIIQCGMSKVYIDGLFGKPVNSDQLFAGFTGNPLRIVGGYLWMLLWLFIWAMVPVVGFVMVIIKSYSYRFVPYILITRPDVTATQALRLSMQMTNGKKSQMFLADLCFGGVIAVGSFILGLFALIPIIGILFGFILAVVLVAYALFGNIFMGLYSAYFYVEASRKPKEEAAASKEEVEA